MNQEYEGGPYGPLRTAAANYGEAQGAESRNGFRTSFRIRANELRETIVWLKNIRRMEIGDEAIVSAAIGEASELTSIFAVSIATAAERNDWRAF